MLFFPNNLETTTPPATNPIIKVVGLDSFGNQYPLTLGSGLTITGNVLNTTGGGSGGGGTATLTYASNGDTNGLFYYLGTSGITATFANPIPFRVWGTMSSDVQDAFPTLTDYKIDRTTNRADGNPCNTNDLANSWIGYRLPAGQTITITDYTIKSRSDSNSQHPVAWVLEVSNNVAANTLAAMNAATWTTLDTRTAQSFTATNQWKRYTTTTPSPVNAWRIRLTAVNSSSTNYFIVNETEFYGTYVF